MRRSIHPCSLVLLLLLLGRFGVKAQPADYVVTNLDNSGEGTLRQGLLAPAKGPLSAESTAPYTISFGVGGTVNLTEPLPDITTRLRLTAAATNSIQLKAANHQIFAIAPGGDLGVEAVTLSAGLTPHGAVHNEGTLSLTNCIFSGNTGSDAGGAIWNSGTLYIDNCVFTSNSVDVPFDLQPVRPAVAQKGGAIYSTNGVVRISNSTFSFNFLPAKPQAPVNYGVKGSSAYGGAIYLASGTAIISASSFISNSIAGGSGSDGVFRSGIGPVEAGVAYGAAIYNTNATLSVFNCTFSGNQATIGYPGIFVYFTERDWDAPVGIAAGGALFSAKGTNQIVNSTFAFNAVSLPPPAPQMTPPSPGTLDGSAIAQNGGLLVIINNLFAGNVGAPDSPSSSSPNISVPSSDLAPLADNGGPTLTHALTWTSSAINSGSALEAPAFDQRRQPRPSGPGVDFGAVEMQGGKPILVTWSPDQTLRVGTNVTLSVEFTGMGPITINWFKEGKPLGVSGSELVLVNVQRTDSGAYTVTASNFFGETPGPEIKLQIDPTPLIYAHTSRPFTVEGEPVTLSSTIFAEAPYSLQWYQNDNPIAGATDPSYQISAMSSSTAGSYKVSIKNAVGQATSDSVSVQLWPELDVTTTADSGPGSLRAAITEIISTPEAAFRSINLPSGSYKLLSPLPTIPNSIHLSGSGARDTEIDGGAKFPLLSLGQNSTCIISHISFANGLTSVNQHGGAIRNSGSLTLSNCWFRFNTSTGGFGGAIYSDNLIVINNCSFQTNSALGQGVAWAGSGAGLGGALFLSGFGGSIINCTFSGNRAIGGSSILLNSPNDCYENGYPGGGPGGFGSGGATGKSEYWHQGIPPWFLSGYWGSPGSPGDFGGGGGCGGCGVSRGLDPSPIPGALGGYGGGNGATNLGRLGAYDSGGGGAGMGAAIFAQSGNVEIRNCTIIHNESQGGTTGEGAGPGTGIAGGIFNYQASVLVQNSVIAQNTAEQNPDFEGTLNSAGFNLFGQPQEGAVLLPTDLTRLDPMLSSSPAMSSETPAYPPLPGSPLIDHGHSTIAQDQRGHPRQLDDPAASDGPGSDLSDIGAYELDLTLRIASLAVKDSHFQLTFNSVAGTTYQLRYKTEITGIWTTKRAVWTGTGDWLTISFDLPQQNAYFLEIVGVP